MATTFAGTLSVALVGSYTKTSDLTSLVESIQFTNSPTPYANGTGSYQCNAFFSDTRTLAATNESFDLNAMVDAYGASLNFAKVKFLYVKNKSTTAGQILTLSGNFLSSMDGGTGPTHVIGPGGIFLMDSPIDGKTVTNTTQDTLTVTNAASFDYDLIIAGTV